MPHPLALFSLEPIGTRAEDVVGHPLNQHVVSILGGRPVLDVGHIQSKANSHTLATIGRDGDIIVEGGSISKVQCAFEIDSNKVVMFYDRSHSQTSQVYGDNATPFEHGRGGRKVVVQQDLNTIIGMGGTKRNLVRFKIRWRKPDFGATKEQIKRRESATLGENPRFARTIDAADTVLPSRRETRIHTPGPKQPELRYHMTDMLGAGQFGDVRKAVDADTGLIMAVKVIRPLSAVTNKEQRDQFIHRFKREVEALAGCQHPCIIDFIALAEWDQVCPKIFMGLKDGNLTSLVQAETNIPIAKLAETVLHHMLQALDYLTVKGIIHRDVKPDNILYILNQGRYQFQLGDMGLCNEARVEVTRAGTPIFMAPELTRGARQTNKLDVWSLFVTLLWTLDSYGFRATANNLRGGETEAQKEAERLAGMPGLEHVAEMGKVEPEERASAAQMLVKCFEGEGLVTPRNQVSPFSGVPAATDDIEITPISPPREKRATTPRTPGVPIAVKPKAQAKDTRAGAGRVGKSKRLPKASPANYSPGLQAYYSPATPPDDAGDPMDVE
ncbi:kinase-like protein [Apiospora sp. TS-2023a]